MEPRTRAPAALAAAIVVMARSCRSDRTGRPCPPPARPRRGIEPACWRTAPCGRGEFPHAFADPHNVVIGPLVFVAAGYTSESTVRRFGGNKFPVLVKAGHTVTVTVEPSVRTIAALGYGPLPQGRSLRLRDGHDTVTFVACRDEQPSGSSADGPVAFWSGSIVADRPSCVPLDVYVDDQPSPLRVGVSLGDRCPTSNTQLPAPE